MDWHKVWVVARHEYLVNVRRAGFIIMTAIVPVLGLAVLLFGAFFGGQARQLGAFFEKQFDVGDKAIGVVDESVYAIETQPPSFVRAYFLLERELRERRAQGLDLPALLDADKPLFSVIQSLLHDGLGRFRKFDMDAASNQFNIFTDCSIRSGVFRNIFCRKRAIGSTVMFNIIEQLWLALCCHKQFMYC